MREVPTATVPSDAFDAVVVGAGPNGLVAANLLADAGWTVVVLEATDRPGGSVRTAELVEPGYRNDVCSAFYPLATEGSPIGQLQLEDHGLRWLRAPVAMAHPASDGACPIISVDLEETVASLGPDGPAWRELYERWQSLEPHLLRSLLGPFPPVRGGLGLTATLGPAGLARLGRFALTPVRRLGEEEFSTEPARRLLAGAALHADLSPEAPLSGFFGWLMCSLGQANGFPVPEGGASSITDALVRRLEGAGGQVVVGAPVSAIEIAQRRAVGARLEDGSVVRARAAVLADVNAPLLFDRLVGADHLRAAFVQDLGRFHWDDATLKVDYALDGPIPWTAPEARRTGTVHLIDDVDGLTASASALARGLVPARPFVLVGQQAATDPSRQPPGKETAWAYTHLPRTIRGDEAGQLSPTWDADDVAGFVDRLEAEIEARAPGFGRLVRGRHVLTPEAFADENPNLDRGAINSGTAQLHQQAIFRPVPGSGRPSTPIRGLYLASASAHPGGGLHGAPGANAARAALARERPRRAFAAARRAGRARAPG